MRYTKKLNFDSDTRYRIVQRDRECIFCKRHYHMHSSTQLGYGIQDIMHYIPRSDMGLGIEENGVLGCRYHHSLLDNGNKGLRKEMLGIMEEHLKRYYPDWQEEKLRYSKYD